MSQHQGPQREACCCSPSAWVPGVGGREAHSIQSASPSNCSPSLEPPTPHEVMVSGGVSAAGGALKGPSPPSPSVEGPPNRPVRGRNSDNSEQDLKPPTG